MILYGLSVEMCWGEGEDGLGSGVDSCRGYLKLLGLFIGGGG